MIVSPPPKHGNPPAFVVRRAEDAYRQADEARKKAEAARLVALAAEHARSQQMAQEAQRALASPHRSLRLALDWFREEWQASFPRRLHDHTEEFHTGEVLGSPAWTERWKAWMSMVDPDDQAPAMDPLRRAQMEMAAGSSMFDRTGGTYLFRLACLDFDMELAALTMDPPLPHVYVAWYAEKAIDRLRELVDRERRKPAPSVSRPEWMDRLGIGKSEAQHAAEDAA